MYVRVVVYVPAGWLPGTFTMYEAVIIWASVPPSVALPLFATESPDVNLKLSTVSYPVSD